MNPKIKEILKYISIPLILMGIYLLMYIIWKVSSLPEENELILIVKEWFTKYGLWIIFIGALIVFLVKKYFFDKKMI